MKKFLEDFSKGPGLALALMIFCLVFATFNLGFLILGDVEELFPKVNPNEFEHMKTIYVLLIVGLIVVLGFFSFAAFKKRGFEELNPKCKGGLKKSLEEGIIWGLITILFVATFDILREAISGISMADSIIQFIQILVMMFVGVLTCNLLNGLEKEMKNKNKF